MTTQNKAQDEYFRTNMLDFWHFTTKRVFYCPEVSKITENESKFSRMLAKNEWDFDEGANFRNFHFFYILIRFLAWTTPLFWLKNDSE